MKKTAFILSISLLFSVFLIFTSCTNSSNSDNDKNFIVMSQNSITFEALGDSAPISAQLFHESGELNEPLTWSSSDPSVAVYEDGIIKTVGYGMCIIRATYKNTTGTCVVYMENPYTTIHIAELAYRFDSIGAAANISVFSGENDITTIVEYTTSNPDIATCNSNGVITTHGYGACVIVARLESQTTATSVIVTNPDEKKITLSESSLSMSVGESKELTAEKTLGVDNDITWLSSNPEIAECNNGVITAKANGICTVTAVTDSGLSDFCIITVGDQAASPQIPAELLHYTMPETPIELLTVNPKTGETIASAVIMSYTIAPRLDEETGRLFLQIYLNCVKTFDITGKDGLTSVHIATNLYRENDEHCERKLYINEVKKVGEEFTIECSLFSVQTEPDTVRTLYMTFENICET